MTTFTLGVKVSGASSCRSLARALQRADMQAALNRKIRTMGSPVLAELRSSAMSIPNVSRAARRDGKSARALIAAAVSLQVRPNGIRFVVDTRKMPRGSEALPRLFERATFRHPVYGTGAWVVQRGHPWFANTLNRRERAFRDACQSAVNEVTDSIKRAT